MSDDWGRRLGAVSRPKVIINKDIEEKLSRYSCEHMAVELVVAIDSDALATRS